MESATAGTKRGPLWREGPIEARTKNIGVGEDDGIGDDGAGSDLRPVAQRQIDLAAGQDAVGLVRRKVEG